MSVFMSVCLCLCVRVRMGCVCVQGKGGGGSQGGTLVWFQLIVNNATKYLEDV